MSSIKFFQVETTCEYKLNYNGDTAHFMNKLRKKMTNKLFDTLHVK